MGIVVLFIFVGIPLFFLIAFISSMADFKNTDESEPELRESKKKKATLFGILALIFVGGMIVTPILLTQYIASHM